MDPTAQSLSSFACTMFDQERLPPNPVNAGDDRIEALMQRFKQLQEDLQASIEQNKRYEDQIKVVEHQVGVFSTIITDFIAKQTQQTLILFKRVESLEEQDSLPKLLSKVTVSERERDVCLFPVPISKQTTDKHKNTVDIREIQQLPRPAPESSKPKKIPKKTGAEFTHEPIPASFSSLSSFSVGSRNPKTQAPKKIVKQPKDGMISCESEERSFESAHGITNVKKQFDFSDIPVNNQQQDQSKQ